MSIKKANYRFRWKSRITGKWSVWHLADSSPEFFDGWIGFCGRGEDSNIGNVEKVESKSRGRKADGVCKECLRIEARPV